MFLTLLLSFFVQAQEIQIPLLSGTYQVTGNYDVLTYRRYETVPAHTAEGQKRLQALKAEGYTCVKAAGNAYNCTKFFHDQTPNPLVTAEVDRRWKGKTFSFYAPIGKPELVTNAEILKQWVVPQKAVLWDATGEKPALDWNPVDYTWTQGLWKVYLGTYTDAAYYSFLIEGTELKITDYVIFQEGLVQDRYFITVVLHKTEGR